MKRSLAFLLPIFLAAPAAADQFVDGQAADVVMGMANFTDITNNYFPGLLALPIGVTRDTVTGKVFVSDGNTNRILRYSSDAAARNGGDPEAVLGQPNFTSASAGTTRSTLDEPHGLHLDARGRLWVADQDNNRVLCYVEAATRATGAEADFVFGQTLFTNNAAATSQTGMSGPSGVWVDDADNLWVGDTTNSRVLCFFAISSKAPGGAAADLVLGQPNFVTGSNGTTAGKMSAPFGVCVDAVGTLWVADTGNHRVLRFDNAAGKANGAAADGVLGQPGFVTNGTLLSQSGMDSPFYLVVEPNGTLWVTQLGQNRALGFFNAANLADGSPASRVLGQPNFVSDASVADARTFGTPAGIALGPEGGLLIVQSFQRRVLRFSPFRTPTIRFTRTKASTSSPVFTTSGRATGEVTRVRYRVGNSAFRTANGTNSWKARVKLRSGSNKIFAFAEGPGGESSLARQTVIKK
ncbi:MAG: NHL repeat-containing protein [Verrucomicrobiae bacterium]|nr:NHL repeat-containing protein [Verrucomicrobiae bacterium]